MADPYSPPLDTERHIRYFTRCLRSLLPHHYTPNDGNRMALGYFILSALDLLTPSPPTAAPATSTAAGGGDRAQFRQWILSCRQPGGGFAGSPSLALPARACEGWDFDARAAVPEHLEIASLPATCFAVMLLAMLAGEEEDAEAAFGEVDRVGTLRWLRRLQREDGSFGEVLGELRGGRGGGWEGEFIAGGKDMRYCYLAAMLRWMLRGDVREGEVGWVEDIDVEGLVRYIGRSQTYDGGIAESSQHEPHAGYAYCAISALSLLDRPLENSSASHGSKAIGAAIADLPSLTHWLVSRQFAYLDPPSDGDENPESENFTEPSSLADLSLDENLQHVGFNGRCNKVADTCYFWWVGGALSIMGQGDLVSRAPSRRFLFEKTQHMIGGFAKHPGGPPDLYHAFFGLAALATMGEPNLKEFDAALAVSVETTRKIEAARRGLLRRGKEGEGVSSLRARVLDMGLLVRGERPTWMAAAGG
ncbi:terpenoid cyclases/protein prenyltransferase alpha-alpha toroid [Phialemonium atrogriseum]|uniref:Terpenoid cyclases/protein prenyltransferase alpha-alpha toroid n=1 Tax=Phialemonium atrogriseum TaxID=1093897 RepID=A0AAJ0C682_9PEZI|nr:terpenoid cyclases/protein prenyltransferase alpha-alpha toroid [Phialemonium atrogriseum]KAK1770237.1 terpenoid cyclases/protein prenyltransferase alpha-alpha toroid [Phialemonium atrogriseum]